MAIKTVNAENLAEYVSTRPKSHELAQSLQSPPVAEVKTGVVGEGAESVSTAPDPGKQPTEEERQAKKPKRDTQDRIDELTRLRKEAEEAWESEYETRLKLEGEIAALKSKPEPKEELKKEELVQPDPAKYTDQGKFLTDYAEWVKKSARAEFAAEQQRVETEKRARELDAAMVEKIARAKADLEDFDDVIDSADKRTRTDIPNHIKAAIYESEYGAHIAYELAKDAALEKRISNLTPAKALLELGKLEQKWVKTPAKADDSPKPPESKQPPEPVTKLKEGAGVVVTDLSQPMSFGDYRRQRLEQIRARRRH
jgi:hypothetical protein